MKVGQKRVQMQYATFSLSYNQTCFSFLKWGGVIVGFTFSFVKPWADGNQLMIEEISVKEEYRRNGIAKSLLKTLVEKAKEKYSVTYVNGTTYLGQDDMPFAWYKRLGFKKDEELFLIAGESGEILKKLNKHH